MRCREAWARKRGLRWVLVLVIVAVVVVGRKLMVDGLKSLWFVIGFVESVIAELRKEMAVVMSTSTGLWSRQRTMVVIGCRWSLYTESLSISRRYHWIQKRHTIFPTNLQASSSNRNKSSENAGCSRNMTRDTTAQPLFFSLRKSKHKQCSTGEEVAAIPLIFNLCLEN
jgi:hypothetical protein